VVRLHAAMSSLADRRSLPPEPPAAAALWAARQQRGSKVLVWRARLLAGSQPESVEPLEPA
jgi:hypothetical protein